jgi:hypothetical protein
MRVARVKAFTCSRKSLEKGADIARHSSKPTETHAKMEPEVYKRYEVWGRAIPQQGRYDASGTITSGRKLIEGSSVLASCDTEDEARTVGMAWARAWIDTHG